MPPASPTVGEHRVQTRHAGRISASLCSFRAWDNRPWNAATAAASSSLALGAGLASSNARSAAPVSP